MIRVLVADDHELVRQGLVALLAQAQDIEVVGEAGDGQQAIAQALKLEPDVILMDVSMPGLDGLRATEQLCAMGHRSRVILLSMLDDSDTIAAAAHAGARGYFIKNSNRDELLKAIYLVYDSQMYASPAIAPFFFANV